MNAKADGRSANANYQPMGKGDGNPSLSSRQFCLQAVYDRLKRSNEKFIYGVSGKSRSGGAASYEKAEFQYGRQMTASLQASLYIADRPPIGP